jgi:hypothetical protein
MRQARWASSDSNSTIVQRSPSSAKKPLWDGGRELGHTVNQRDVILAHTGHETGPEDSNNHGESP